MALAAIPNHFVTVTKSSVAQGSFGDSQKLGIALVGELLQLLRLHY
jgi:hypothetical protein